MRQMGGSSLGDAEVRDLVKRVFKAAGAEPAEGLKLPEFKAALEGAKVNLCVDVPIED